MMSKISIPFHDVKDTTLTKVFVEKKCHILGKNSDVHILKRILLNIIVIAIFNDHLVKLIIFIHVKGSKLTYGCVRSAVNLSVLVLII